MHTCNNYFSPTTHQTHHNFFAYPNLLTKLTIIFCLSIPTHHYFLPIHTYSPKLLTKLTNYFLPKQNYSPNSPLFSYPYLLTKLTIICLRCDCVRNVAVGVAVCRSLCRGLASCCCCCYWGHILSQKIAIDAQWKLSTESMPSH